MQKSILITGCSSGIGLDAAHGMRARGWRVFAACRHQRDCDRLRAQGFDSPRIDYTDAETITSGLASVLEATGGTLEALFNNGAHGLPGAIEDVPTDGLRHIFETNVFGWHELTRQVIPVMRAQGHGRIVQNSSVLGLVAFPWRGAYVATKYAIEGLTDTMRLELRGTGIKVLLLVVIGFFAFKSFALAAFGPVTYNERLAKLESGSVVEQVGAKVLAIDPATQGVANFLGPVLR